jgi:hypothetical protein
MFLEAFKEILENKNPINLETDQPTYTYPPRSWSSEDKTYIKEAFEETRLRILNEHSETLSPEQTKFLNEYTYEWLEVSDIKRTTLPAASNTALLEAKKMFLETKKHSLQTNLVCSQILEPLLAQSLVLADFDITPFLVEKGLTEKTHENKITRKEVETIIENTKNTPIFYELIQEFLKKITNKNKSLIAPEKKYILKKHLKNTSSYFKELLRESDPFDTPEEALRNLEKQITNLSSLLNLGSNLSEVALRERVKALDSLSHSSGNHTQLSDPHSLRRILTTLSPFFNPSKEKKVVIEQNMDDRKFRSLFAALVDKYPQFDLHIQTSFLARYMAVCRTPNKETEIIALKDSLIVCYVACETLEKICNSTIPPQDLGTCPANLLELLADYNLPDYVKLKLLVDMGNAYERDFNEPDPRNVSSFFERLENINKLINKKHELAHDNTVAETDKTKFNQLCDHTLDILLLNNDNTDVSAAVNALNKLNNVNNATIDKIEECNNIELELNTIRDRMLAHVSADELKSVLPVLPARQPPANKNRL